jgi:translation initiation factor IF-3
LAEGSKVKVTIMFRGREMAHPELGKRILDRIAEQVREIGIVESAPKQDGRNMIMILGPAKKIEKPAPAAKPRTADSTGGAEGGAVGGEEPPAATAPVSAVPPAT